MSMTTKICIDKCKMCIHKCDVGNIHIKYTFLNVLTCVVRAHVNKTLILKYLLNFFHAHRCNKYKDSSQ